MNQAEQVRNQTPESFLHNPYKTMEYARSIGLPSLGFSDAMHHILEWPDDSVWRLA